MGLTFEIETFKLVKSRLSDWKMIDLYFYRTLVILNMLEEKVFLKFVANYFNFDETLISRESNIRTLCIVSLFLEGLDYSIKGKIQIDKIKLERKVEIETDGRDITVDLTDFFKLYYHF